MSQASEYAANVSRILQDKANAQAQGHLQRGQILGNTIATLGQIVPQQVQDVMRKNAEKRKTEQIQGIFQKHGGDLPSAIPEVMQLDPDLGMDLAKRYQDAATAAFNYKSAQWKAKKDEIETLGNLMGSATDQDSYTQALVTAKLMGLPMQGVPTEYNPQVVEQYNRAALTAKERLELEKPKEPGPLVPIPGPDGKPVYGTREQAIGQAVPSDPTTTGPLVPIPGPNGTTIYGTRDQAVGQTVPQSAQTGGVNAGSFEDYVIRYARDKGKPVDALTAADIQNARKLYQQADDRPRITVNTGGGGGTAKLPAAYQAALSRATINLPAVRRGNLETAARLAFEQGGEAALADVVRQAAVDTEPVDIRNQVLGRMATLASINDTEAILKEMKAKGVPTNILAGSVEDVARKLGTSTNPEYVAMANRLMGTLINYRRAATGVSFSAAESADYQRMFPNYRNTLPVNLALLSGLRREMATYDKTYWTHKLGSAGAQLVGMIPGGAAPARKAGDPKTDPLGIR